jgi:CelD/BcsL family acetyltransferase involved in cellulose biosynthesis
MLVNVIPACQLSSEVQQWWRTTQNANPRLDSPYFCPEFTAAVDSVRDDVYIAVIENQRGVVTVFPFQRTWYGVGRPVGGPVCDFQGIISRQDLTLDPRWLARCCGVQFWDLPCVLTWQSTFQSWQTSTIDAPYMELSCGFEAYCDQRRAVESHQVRDTQRQLRRLGRKVGPVHFEYDIVDKRVLDTLFLWKSAQYRATGMPDGLHGGWIPRLLHRIYETKSKHFSGVLSALYAGDHLVAAHFGMQSERVLHWWYPAYDPKFSTYSPGLILCLELAREACSRGISRIDLGYGYEPYKLGFMSGSTSVAEVAVDATSLARSMRRGWRFARKLIKATPLAAQARRALRSIRG